MSRIDLDMILESESVAEFLRSEFVRRMERNSRYSMRAFARDLDMSAGRLSENLNQRKTPSLTTIEKIATRLKLSREATETLRDLSLSANARKNLAVQTHARERLATRKKKSTLRELSHERFKVMSEWHHSAIIELTEIKGFQSKPDWIARKLSIPVETAESAVARLVKLSMLTERSGRLIANPDIFSTPVGVPSKAVQQYHRQMIEKAHRSIDGLKPGTRDLNSMILAVPEARFAELRDKIQVFLKSFWEDVKDDERDRLYALNIQFFPVSQKESSDD